MLAEAMAALVLAARPFGITVVDRDGGVPVPGAVLETTNRITLATDRNGNAAFQEPGLEGQEVYFTFSHPAYEAPSDGFGFRGFRLTVTGGEGARVMVDRAPDAGTPPSGPFGDEATRLLARDAPGPSELFEIRVVDAATGRGVPLVEVRGPRHTFVTDSAGRIAYFDLDGMGTEAAFEVSGHGYAFEGDGGGSSVLLTPRGGESVTLRVRRLLPAERLYRVTGGGIYRDTVMLGHQAPVREPLISGLVFGQDGTNSAVYRGAPFFIWGDTVRPAYPLGNFHGSGARAALPGRGGLSPSVGIDLQYYVDESGFSRPMAPIPGPGPTWLSGLVALPDAAGRERLLALYGKYPGFTEVEAGVVQLEDASDHPSFEKVAVWDEAAKVRLSGHAFVWRGPSGARAHFGRFTRAPATAEALADPSAYEAFTPLSPAGSVARDGRGDPAWAWRSRAPPLPPDASAPEGMRPDQLLAGHEVSFPGGARLTAHADNVAWNAHRRRFVRIFGEAWGAASFLGELWYAEADTPMGPWVHSAHAVTHDDYTCYNPRHHPFLDEEGGRRIYFECTYAQIFSGSKVATPRYDYNQVMYRLDLDDPRLLLPAAVYGTALARDLPPDGPPRAPDFFAFDRPAPGAIPVTRSLPCDPPDLHPGGPPGEEVAFWALPEDGPPGPGGAVPLYRYFAGGERVFSTNPHLGLLGFDPGGAVARVWPSPISVALPLSEYRGPLRASAGPDRCAPPGPLELDGSSSWSAEGAPASYRWTVEETSGAAAPVSIDGPRATLSLPAGVYRATLEVTSAGGERAADVAVLQLRPGAGGGCACGAGGGEALGAAAALASLLRARRRLRGRPRPAPSTPTGRSA